MIFKVGFGTPLEGWTSFPMGLQSAAILEFSTECHHLEMGQSDYFPVNLLEHNVNYFRLGMEDLWQHNDVTKSLTLLLAMVSLPGGCEKL